MTHETLMEQLGPLLDGELPVDAEREVRAHLEGCAVCRGRLDQLSRLSRSIRTIPREPMPADLKAAILDRIEAPRAPASGRRPVWASPWTYASLAGAAIVAAAGLVALRQEPPPPAGAIAPSAPVASMADADTSPAAPRDAAVAERQESTKPGRTPAAEPPASPAETRRKLRARVSPPPPPRLDTQAGGAETFTARFRTTAIFRDSRIAALAPLEPAAQLPGAEEAGGLGAQAAAPRGELAAGDDTRAPGATLQALPQVQEAATSTVLTYWVQLDAEGRVVLAQPIGARTEAAATVNAVAALLRGAAVPPGRSRRAMAAVIEVTVPPASAPQ